MIHVITVHHKSDKFIDLQLENLARTGDQYNIWYVLDEVDWPALPLPERIHQVNKINPPHRPENMTDARDHAQRLDYAFNILALKQVDDRSWPPIEDDDLVMFLDGDAWPVKRNIEQWARNLLDDYVFVAVRRTEFGHVQPHPSFLITTVQRWRNHSNFTWKVTRRIDKPNKVDIGMALYNEAVERRLPWLALDYINAWEPYTNLASLYGIDRGGFGPIPVVYHHGRGFRSNKSVQLIYQAAANGKSLETRRDHRRYSRLLTEAAKLSDEWLDKAHLDPDFWKVLI